MELTLLIAGVSIALLVSIVMIVARARKTHQRNRQIAESLDTIRNAVELNRLKGIHAPDFNIDTAFEILRSLAPDSAADLMLVIKEMEDRCREIERRVDEFKAQDTVSTLQSSLTTGKTDKLVVEIHQLAQQIEEQLGHRPKKS